MRKVTCILFLMSMATGAAAQTVAPPVISPRLENSPFGPSQVLDGSFIAYKTGASEGSTYYLLSTNNYRATTARPPGECSYHDTVTGSIRVIGEQVVGYSGANTFAFLHSSNPAFTRARTMSPCFDGRFGEATEQQHRTGAYGGGSTVTATAKGKVYELVNRTRITCTPTSTSPYQMDSTGTAWDAGDFDQIFIGAKESLASAFSVAVSSSGTCLGQANPPASETCNSPFAWNLTPIVLITDNLVDPNDGQTKTFTALPPVLGAYDSTVEKLPVFNGIGALGATLFGFMQFGNICTAWNTSGAHGCPQTGGTKPTCTQIGLPSRLAAVFIADPSTTSRPSLARLYFKKGSSWIGMNADGTFPTVPDDYSLAFPININGSYSDIKYDPIALTWKLWAGEGDSTATNGCANTIQPQGSHFAYFDLATAAKTTLWPTVNGSGRGTPSVFYAFSSACNCLREFIFYTSTDYACYNVLTQWENRSASNNGREVVVRRTLDGPPN